MNQERTLRGIAGFFVLVSLALGHWVHWGFYLFTAFVGVNLFQSAFTNWCPMMWILGRCGVPPAGGPKTACEPHPSKTGALG